MVWADLTYAILFSRSPQRAVTCESLPFTALCEDRLNAMPFGLELHAFLRIVDAVRSAKVVGVALSEVAPARDERDRCCETLMWLVEYLLRRRYEGG